MTIHLITGMQGSGKTLLMVKKAYEYHLMGKTIYSNVNLHFPYRELTYEEIVNCELENAIVILDECHLLLPSRRSLSKINVQIVDGFLSMVRKKGLTIFGSTQTQRKVDVRFREEADYIYRCEKWVYINKRWKRATESEDFDPSIPVMISFICMQVGTDTILQKSFYGNDLYNLYDTREIVEIKGLNRY